MNRHQTETWKILAVPERDNFKFLFHLLINYPPPLPLFHSHTQSYAHKIPLALFQLAFPNKILLSTSNFTPARAGPGPVVTQRGACQEQDRIYPPTQPQPPTQPGKAKPQTQTRMHWCRANKKNRGGNAFEKTYICTFKNAVQPTYVISWRAHVCAHLLHIHIYMCVCVSDTEPKQLRLWP